LKDWQRDDMAYDQDLANRIAFARSLPPKG
jgi:hypothetical protein